MSAEQDLVHDLYILIAGKDRVSGKRVRALLAPHLPERYSVCPIDGEPLVSSLEVKFKEWVCEACSRYYSFLGVPVKTATPDLHVRYWELLDVSRKRRAETAA